MNTEKVYYDIYGNERNIFEMIRFDTHWSAYKIQEGEEAIEVLRQIVEGHKVSSVNWDAMKKAEKIIKRNDHK
jgi:hypothetical protein